MRRYESIQVGEPLQQTRSVASKCISRLRIGWLLRRYESIRVGEPAELLVLSQRRRFDTFKVPPPPVHRRAHLGHARCMHPDEVDLGDPPGQAA